MATRIETEQIKAQKEIARELKRIANVLEDLVSAKREIRDSFKFNEKRFTDANKNIKEDTDNGNND